jgi:putative MFS transporter
MKPSRDDGSPHKPLDLIDRLDCGSLSGMHLLALACCALGFAFDLAEIAFGAAMSGVFSAAPYEYSSAQPGRFLAAPYVGAIVGPLLIGRLADLYGRRPALSGALVLLSLVSFFGACNPDLAVLGGSRAVAGLALGAFPPLTIAYLTELLPPRQRGTLIMAVVGIGYLGPPGTIFLLRWLTSLEPIGVSAWRWVLAADGAGATCGGLVFLILPESPRWLLSAGRFGAATLASHPLL